jgi:hypothetical protein
MTCVQPFQNGFAIGLAQTIVGAFGVSPTRVCNAQLSPTFAPNDIDISVVKFTFFITDVRPQFGLLHNDYLPSACIGSWVLSWLSKSTSVTAPNQAVTPVPASIPANLRSDSCPAIPTGAPAPTLYFTSKVSADVNIPEYIENLKRSFGSSFAHNSMLSGIFIPKKIEHATNVSGTSVQLTGSTSSIYPSPQTLFDYIGLYSYPLSFVGAILFSIISIIDINLNTLVANKNFSLIINLAFIVWSIISLTIFYNVPVYSVPILGSILSFHIPYILPFNTQSVIIQA